MKRPGDSKSILTGVIFTLAVHACALLLVSFSGIKYLYPPPAETSFVMDMTEVEEEEPLENPLANQAADKANDDDSEVEIVKKSESVYESKSENLTPAVKQNNHGDVEVPAVKQETEPKLDPRASFPGMAKKDTSLTSPHSAEKASDRTSPGMVSGNSESGKTEGKASAKLEGRTVVGVLKKPVYSVQESGVVVVRIIVDQYGEVKSAVPGAPGTTVSDAKLWAAARSAAMGTKFSMKADAPAEQEGTITYIFNLR